MTTSSIERKARAGLPIIRFMQVFLPLKVLRWLLKKGMAHVQLDADVTREAVSADGVPCEWIISKQSKTDQVLLYLHGGGFGLGVFLDDPKSLLMGDRLYMRHMDISSFDDAPWKDIEA